MEMQAIMNVMCLDHPKTTLLPAKSMGKSPSTRLVPGAKKAGECVCVLSWGMGCHFLLQVIFPTQESNPHPLHWQADSLPLTHQRSPTLMTLF